MYFKKALSERKMEISAGIALHSLFMKWKFHPVIWNKKQWLYNTELLIFLVVDVTGNLASHLSATPPLSHRELKLRILVDNLVKIIIFYSYIKGICVYLFLSEL